MAQMTIRDLEDSLLNAQKQLAKVDKEYVGYDHRGHLFEYDINYIDFLKDISYVISEGTKKGLDFETRNK